MATCPSPNGYGRLGTGPHQALIPRLPRSARVGVGEAGRPQPNQPACVMRKQPCHPVGLTLIPIWVSCSGEGGLSKSDDDYKGGKARLVVSQHLGGGLKARKRAMCESTEGRRQPCLTTHWAFEDGSTPSTEVRDWHSFVLLSSSRRMRPRDTNTKTENSPEWKNGGVSAIPIRRSGMAKGKEMEKEGRKEGTQERGREGERGACERNTKRVARETGNATVAASSTRSMVYKKHLKIPHKVVPNFFKKSLYDCCLFVA